MGKELEHRYLGYTVSTINRTAGHIICQIFTFLTALLVAAGSPRKPEIVLWQSERQPVNLTAASMSKTNSVFSQSEQFYWALDRPQD